jgi:hypothetical protein
MDAQSVLSVPLFAGLSKEERRTMGQHTDKLDFEEGRVLVRAGEFHTSSSSSTAARRR